MHHVSHFLLVHISLNRECIQASYLEDDIFLSGVTKNADIISCMYYNNIRIRVYKNIRQQIHLMFM